MDYFGWNNEMATGIEVIDAQHQEIAMHVNAVYRAVCLRLHSEEQAAVRELIECIGSHLSFEEELLEAANYPGFVAHKRAHSEFRRRMERYFAVFLDGNDVSLALITDLRMWLTTHIRYDDAEYAPYLQQLLTPKRHRKNPFSLSRMFGKGDTSDAAV